jgi:hypothetical protein
MPEKVNTATPTISGAGVLAQSTEAWMSPTSTPAQATVVSLRADCARRQRRTATGGTAKCCPAARPARTAHLHAGAGAQRRTWPLRASVGRRCTVRTASPANMALARSTSATLRSPGTWKSCCGLWVQLWDAGGTRCIDAGAGCAGLPHRTRKHHRHVHHSPPKVPRCPAPP